MKVRKICTLLLAVLVLAGCGGVNAAAAALTPEQAEKIALDHAGFTADQVKGLRTEYERDDGVPRWEVHFHQGPWEYDYEIHADTGDLLSWDRDD